MNVIEAYNQFWNSFEMAAYDENTVPEGSALPYITYSISEAYFNEPVAASVSLWYRSTLWQAISDKAKLIGDYIGRGGRLINFDGGVLWIKRGTPFAQRMSDEDDSIRRILLNIELEYVR